jgi:O-6-methylguanine DNA methyltransferase
MSWTVRPLTDFEKKVYAIVRKIPKGEVRSYKWVAAEIGNPYLARAVGTALSRNTDPSVVPCHRVIRSDGNLGGYAWGLAKKKRLLKNERNLKKTHSR